MKSHFNERVLAHLHERHGDLHAYWLGGGDLPPARKIEEHCDFVYSCYLLESSIDFSGPRREQFLELVGRHHLAGFESTKVHPVLSVHNTAYLFGALNLLAVGEARAELYELVLEGRTAVPSQLVNPGDSTPVFPSKWGHHSWRVSHWLGGIPSLILSLERSESPSATAYRGLFHKVRRSIDALIDSRTGMIKAYRSELVQMGFRALYGIRHSPKLGDIGGIAHILWVDHVTDRPYIAPQSIYDRSREAFLGHYPFMERVPYCLDFDVVQSLRTSSVQLQHEDSDVKSRAEEMKLAIEAFFAAPPDGYTLHKVPGALATHHECRLLLGDTSAKDIIQAAHWL